MGNCGKISNLCDHHHSIVNWKCFDNCNRYEEQNYEDCDKFLHSEFSGGGSNGHINVYVGHFSGQSDRGVDPRGDLL